MTIPIRSITASICLLAMSIFTGCTSSVYPLLTKAELSNDLDLRGEWEVRESKPKKEGGSLKLTAAVPDDLSTYDFEDKSKSYTIEVGKVGESYYVQYHINPESLAQGEAVSLPLYYIARVKLVNGELHLFAMENSKLLQTLDKEKIPYMKNEAPDKKTVVLTAQTAQLQSLVKNAGTSIFVEKPIIFIRKQ